MHEVNTVTMLRDIKVSAQHLPRVVGNKLGDVQSLGV